MKAHTDPLSRPVTFNIITSLSVMNYKFDNDFTLSAHLIEQQLMASSPPIIVHVEEGLNGALLAYPTQRNGCPPLIVLGNKVKISSFCNLMS